MRGKNMLIGPEETSVRAMMLKLLMALDKSGLHRLEVSILHRSFGEMKRGLDAWEKQRKDLPFSLHRIDSSLWRSDDGTYRVLEDFLRELAFFGVVMLKQSEQGDVVSFESGASHELKESLTRLCDFIPNEEGYYDALGKVGETFYRRNARGTCCD